MTSLISQENYDSTNHWYSNGIRVVWWDRRTKHWITYLVDAHRHQQGDADYHPNKKSFVECEANGWYKFEDDHDELRKLLG